MPKDHLPTAVQKGGRRFRAQPAQTEVESVEGKL